MQVIYTDILIIGSGAAGLAASVYAGESDNEVLVIDKGAIGKSGSTVGAVQVASLGPWSHPNDSSHNYSADIATSGRGLSDPDLIETLVKHISSRLSDLTEWGLKLDTDDKFNVSLSATSGHSLPRSVSAKKGKTGLGILQTLIRKAKTLQNVETWSDVITLDLIVSSNRVTGAVVLDLTTNTTFLIKSKTVILATGGAGQLYPVTSNPIQATSDGFSLALSAGGTLMDMEQVQFYPVSIIAPESLSGFCISFYHYSKLYNNLGERFMEKYEPKELENTTRDKLAIAIATEIAEGRGTPNGGVWLDASEQLDQVKTEFPHEYALCSERGINLENGFAEIGPAAHFMMGGIPINVDTSTTVDGLFVAGETAGGLHGGNRLGNNALSECLVFGEKAGKAAAKTASISSTTAVIKEEEYKKAETIVKHLFFDKNGDIRPYQFKHTIQSILGQHAGVLRSTRGLAMAEKQLQIAQEKLKNIQLPSTDSYSREILDYVESVHMLRTAQAIVKAAQSRKESRGAHFNKDFPHLSDKVCHTFCSLGQNEVACKYLPVKEERLWKSFTSK